MVTIYGLFVPGPLVHLVPLIIPGLPIGSFDNLIILRVRLVPLIILQDP